MHCKEPGDFRIWCLSGLCDHITLEGVTGQVYFCNYHPPSHFMDRNLQLRVNPNFCLTSPKADLVSKSSRTLNPIDKGVPEDGLVPRKEFGRVLKTDSWVGMQSDGLCLRNYQQRNLCVLTDSASSACLHLDNHELFGSLSLRKDLVEVERTRRWVIITVTEWLLVVE